MSRKRKQPTSVPVKSDKPEEVAYKIFFYDCLARGLVKPWQENEIHAFFRDLGLKDKEPADRYKDALAKF